MTRPHESPDCRCEACRMHDDPLTTACDRARAMLVATLDRMPAERRKVYAVDDGTVSFDSLGDSRSFVGYAMNIPPLSFPVLYDAVAVDVVTGGTFVFRVERCESCARIDDTVTTGDIDGPHLPLTGTIDPAHYRQ